MKLSHIFFLSGFLFLLTGCLGDDSPPSYEDAEGVVLSSSGEPVNDANIHIRNHFNPGGFLADTSAVDSITISFQAPSSDLYQASIFRHGADTILATFFEDTLQSGSHVLTVPDSLLSNGIFGYEIRNSLGPITANLFLVNKPDSLLPGTLPFTKSGTDGQFTLNTTYLAIGRIFDTRGGGAFEVTDSLEIIISNEQNVLKEKRVRIVPDQANFFEIIID